MNIAWEQHWLEQFNNNIDVLMENYPEEFEYEDLMLGVRIENDKIALRKLFSVFENSDRGASSHYFNATRYHGDEHSGCVEWTWKIIHRSDFLGLPSKGKITLVRGMTIHSFRAGKIILERSLWDAAALMRQLGMPAPAAALQI